MDKYIWTYGGIAGGACIAFVFFLYTMDISYLVKGWEQFNWLIILLTMLVATSKIRSPKGVYMPQYTLELLANDAPKLDNFVPVHSLLKRLFGIFTLAYILKFVFIYLLFHYIDPNLNELAQEAAMKIFIENRDPKMPEEIFQKSLEAFREHSFAPAFDFLGLFLYLFIGFIFAFIFAHLFKREEPVI